MERISRGLVRTVALIGLLLTGCATERLALYEASHPVGADQVILVGRAKFDPPLYMGGARGFFDPAGQGRQLILGFTDSPNRPVSADTWLDIDDAAAVVPGEPFALVVPRRPLFLRSVQMFTDAGFGSGFLGRPTRTLYYRKCVTDLPIEIRPEDRVIYVGLIVCALKTDPEQVNVWDEWSTFGRIAEELVGELPISQRVLSLTRPRAPSGDTAGVAPSGL